MTNQKKISRRDAIKVLGAATGASLLANLPAKWSKPELTGAVLPAHAQTSNCPIGSSAMSVFVEGSGSIRIFQTSTNTGNNYPTGITTTIYSGCLSECFYISVQSLDTTDVHVIVTLNGSIVDDLTYNNGFHYFIVNGATGDYALDDNPDGCSFG